MATTEQVTAEDLARMSDDECRYDLIRGEIIRVAPAGFEHGDIALAIGAELRTFAKQQQLGRVVGAETGFILARDPDVVLAPDAAFVRSDRLPPEGEREGFLPLAPDLAVEVVSPSDNESHVNDKVMEYLDAGVQLIWIVYPRRHTVTVYTTDRRGRILTDDETLDGGDVLPGLQIPLTDIFNR